MAYQEPIPEVQAALARIEAAKDALDELAAMVRKLATVPRETTMDGLCALTYARTAAGLNAEQQAIYARIASADATNTCVARWERGRTR